MEPCSQTLSLIAESIPRRNIFLIAFEENMYQFCFLLIRLDVCHHHSSDLWPLRKWFDGLLCPEVGQQLEDRRLQTICSILYRWLVLINASVDAWEKGVEQFPSARAAGGSGMGCLRGITQYQGGGTAGPREVSLSPPGLQGLWTQHLLLKALLFTWHLYWAMPWQFNPLTGRWGGGTACEHLAWPKSPLCTQCLNYSACQSLPKLSTSLFVLLVSY